LHALISAIFIADAAAQYALPLNDFSIDAYSF